MHSKTSSSNHFSLMQSYEILIHIAFFYFICKDSITVETHIREPVSIRNSGAEISLPEFFN